MRRRTLLLSSAAVVASSAASYVIGTKLPPRKIGHWLGIFEPPPPPGLVAAEFASGRTAEIGQLTVSLSEQEWLWRNHPDVFDPFEVTELLRPS